MSVFQEPFGYTKQGEPAYRYTLTNQKGMTVHLVSYAASIQSIIVPDRDGNMVDVALGFDTIKAYENHSGCFGAMVGRVANRIRKSRFAIDGVEYHLTPNEGANHLHGSYRSRNFAGAPDEHTNSVSFTIVSPDGEEGYPGTVCINYRYTLTEDNKLVLDYTAFTDKATLLNLTNHVYFNLSGHNAGTALDTQLQMNASRYTVSDSENLLTGEVAEAAGSPFDFRQEKPLGQDIGADHPMLKFHRGYDVNMVLDQPSLEVPAAVAKSAKTGITMTYFTTQPGTQLYAGNNISHGGKPQIGKNGAEYRDYDGFCLESQHFPCAADFDQFDTTVLRPGEVYRQSAVYQFSAE